MTHPPLPTNNTRRRYATTGPDPVVGDRVIVRRHLADTPGHLTDVIGHIVSLEPLVIRPQTVGGLSSHAATITIDWAVVEVLKKLSPRRVMNRDIRAIEQAGAAAFPGVEHTWAGQWLMRAGDGLTERSNSAVPLGPSAGLTPVPLQEITDFYRRHSLPVRLMIPDRIGNPAAAIARGPGWVLGPDIIVMSRELSPESVGLRSDTPASGDTHAGGDTGTRWEQPVDNVRGHGEFLARVDDAPDDDWLALYHFRGQALPEHALRLLMDSLDGTLGFGRVVEASTGVTVAITRATVTSSDDGRLWLGFSAVETAPAWRRRGLASALGAMMLRWGLQHGACGAYLDVISSNTAGQGLYRQLGFEEHHRHRCARFDG